MSVTTAADPSYPGAHAVDQRGGADVLSRFFGDNERLRSHLRSACRGSNALVHELLRRGDEASLSRIYAGQHFRFDQEAGQKLGTQVARFVLANALLPDAGR